ncbi:hypothetical protein AB1N83_004708 [Pleurotus pulmonarius]
MSYSLPPELLCQIFDSDTLQYDDQVIFARVCKSWCDIVASLIWKKVPNIEVLFRLLAPFTLRDEKLAFDRSLKPEDWERFDYYAYRVHDLDQIGWSLHPSIFTEISTSRLGGLPPSGLLPNLRRLQHYHCTFEYIDFFLHPTVTTLVLAPLTGWHSLGPVLESLPIRTPHIATLSISALAYPLTKDAERLVTEVLPKLSSLASISLPSLWPTGSVVNALASCSSLSKLSTAPIFRNQHTGDSSPELFSTSISPTGFPLLSTLQTSLTFCRATEVLSQGEQFSTLSRLLLRSPRIEIPQEYGALLTALSNYCPDLEHLALCITLFPRPTYHSDCLTYRELSPLRHLTRLQTLSLQHTNSFQLGPEDFITIIRALPSLTELDFNPIPYIKTTPTLNISILSILRDLCPNLRFLGLYLDAREQYIPPHPPSEGEGRFDRPMPELSEFPHLKVFKVGMSPISSPAKLATYLCRLLPHSCNLISTWDEDEGEEDREAAQKWGEVVGLIRAAKQV